MDLGYRVAYDSSYWRAMDEDYKNGLGGALNQEIRKLHRSYGNYNTTGKYLVVSNGANVLMNAFISVVSKIRGGAKQNFFANTPYYFFYPDKCNVVNCNFSSSTNLDPAMVVEAVTEPNNPDGFSRDRFYTTNPYWFNDLVYYWPHLGGFGYNMQMKNSDVALFSLTKLSGHASCRFGWAFVKDLQLAQAMSSWLLSVLALSSSTSGAFAVQVFKELNQNGNQFFNWARDRLEKRWDQLNGILGTQQNIILRSKVGTQYAWLEFVGKNDTEVLNMCSNLGLKPDPGMNFGQSGYMRLNLCETDIVFERTLQAMQTLVTNYKEIEKLPRQRIQFDAQEFSFST